MKSNDQKNVEKTPSFKKTLKFFNKGGLNNKGIIIGVGGIILSKKKKILLCHSPKKWNDHWVIPGGKLEYGEDPKETLKREIKEELGIEIKILRLGGIRSALNPKDYWEKDKHFILIDYICEAVTEDVKILNDEHDEFCWIEDKKALNMKLLSYTREPLEKYLKEKDQLDYLEGWKRCKADFLNYQKKMSRTLLEIKDNATEEVVLNFIPVLDNFDLAMRHIPQEEKNNDWIKGIEYIKKQMEDILIDLGVQKMEALGKDFDPNFHESIEEVESTKEIRQDKGKIVEVLKNGYIKGDKVICPARVKIAK